MTRPAHLEVIFACTILGALGFTTWSYFQVRRNLARRDELIPVTVGPEPTSLSTSVTLVGAVAVQDDETLMTYLLGNGLLIGASLGAVCGIALSSLIGTSKPVQRIA
jgi:hypothetical protein